MLGGIGQIEGPAEFIGLCTPRVTLADDGGVDDAVGPRNKVSFLIDAGAEAVHAGGAVAIVGEVVFAGPDELDGALNAARDLEGLMIEGRAEAAAQASTHEGDVDGDIAFVEAKDPGCVLLGSCAGLGRGPYLAAATFEPFIFVMNSGDRYEVRQWEMAVWDGDMVTVFQHRSNRRNILRVAEISVLEILDSNETE